jgi:hypothetical protein
LNSETKGRALRATNSDTDSVLHPYESALAALMRNQQVALAACLAASAVAHLPIQSELPPIQAPNKPAKLVAIRTGAKATAAKTAKSTGVGRTGAATRSKRSHPPSVSANRLRTKTAAARQASIMNARRRLRFILERESLKRANSIGKHFVGGCSAFCSAQGGDRMQANQRPRLDGEGLCFVPKYWTIVQKWLMVSLRCITMLMVICRNNS